MRFKKKLELLGACDEALIWVGNKGAQRAWDECHRPEWMGWMLDMGDRAWACDLLAPEIFRRIKDKEARKSLRETLHHARKLGGIPASVRAWKEWMDKNPKNSLSIRPGGLFHRNPAWLVAELTEWKYYGSVSITWTQADKWTCNLLRKLIPEVPKVATPPSS